jgi:hypothetical protein
MEDKEMNKSKFGLVLSKEFDREQITFWLTKEELKQLESLEKIWGLKTRSKVIRNCIKKCYSEVEYEVKKIASG